MLRKFVKHSAVIEMFNMNKVIELAIKEICVINSQLKEAIFFIFFSQVLNRSTDSKHVN